MKERLRTEGRFCLWGARWLMRVGGFEPLFAWCTMSLESWCLSTEIVLRQSNVPLTLSTSTESLLPPPRRYEGGRWWSMVVDERP